MKNVGLIGVGVMGRLMVPRILDAGHRLAIYDVSKAALEDAASRDTIVGDSPAHVAAKSDLVLMSLPGPKQVEEVVNGPEGLLTKSKPGMAIVDLSTVDPETTVLMAKAAKQRKVGYLDAPVLGRPESVGEWSLPVGGDSSTVAECIDVLKLFARNVFHIGPSGSGNKVKLLNQMMFSAINCMTAEMMSVSEKVGIPPALLYKTISASQAGTVSGLFKELGKRITTGDYDSPTFRVDLLCKDVALAMKMARDAKAEIRLSVVTQEMNHLAQSRGFGQKDTSIMWQVWRMLADEIP